MHLKFKLHSKLHYNNIIYTYYFQKEKKKKIRLPLSLLGPYLQGLEMMKIFQRPHPWLELYYRRRLTGVCIYLFKIIH